MDVLSSWIFLAIVLLVVGALLRNLLIATSGPRGSERWLEIALKNLAEMPDGTLSSIGLVTVACAIAGLLVLVARRRLPDRAAAGALFVACVLFEIPALLPLFDITLIATGAVVSRGTAVLLGLALAGPASVLCFAGTGLIPGLRGLRRVRALVAASLVVLGPAGLLTAARLLASDEGAELGIPVTRVEQVSFGTFPHPQLVFENGRAFATMWSATNEPGDMCFLHLRRWHAMTFVASWSTEARRSRHYSSGSNACREGHARPSEPEAEPEYKLRAPFRGPAPMFVLLESNAWTGSWPRVVLYEDRTLLRRVEARDAPLSWTVSHLPAAQYDALLSRWNALGFEGLRSCYDLLPEATDIEVARLGSWVTGRRRMVEVRGYSEQAEFQGAPRLAAMGIDDDADVLPLSFLRAAQELLRLEGPAPKPWAPAWLALTLVPYEDAPDDPALPWPSAWPGLEDATTQERGDGFRIFVPEPLIPKVIAFLAQKRDRQAVRIGGRKWAVYRRPVFPSEQRWQYRTLAY